MHLLTMTFVAAASAPRHFRASPRMGPTVSGTTTTASTKTCVCGKQVGDCYVVVTRHHLKLSHRYCLVLRYADRNS